MQLRDYQEKAIQKMRQVISSGKKRIVFVLPTGGGKSVVFGQIIKNYLKWGLTQMHRVQNLKTLIY